MLQLYECSKDIQAALDADFESEKEREDTIAAVIGQGEAAAANVLGYALNIKAEAEMIDKRIQELEAARKYRIAKADSIKHHLKVFMERHGIKSIKAEDGTFHAVIKKNPPKTHVFDEHQIPKEFWREKVTFAVNLTEVKKAIQSGQDVPGVKLETSTRLEVK